jgi:II/X family phage/plasmid replication protein
VACFGLLVVTLWSLFTDEHLRILHNEYFAPLIGEVEVFDMKDSVLEKIKSVTSSNLQATRAYGHWLQIQQIGYESWKDLIPRATFYWYKKILLDAGLSYSDFQASNIVPI